MLFNKKTDWPMFKIEISTWQNKPKYVLKKFDPYARFKFEPYEIMQLFDTHEEAISAMNHYIEFPQYYDNTGKRVG